MVDILVLATYITRDQAGAAQATLAIINALAVQPWVRLSLYAYHADRSLLHPAVRVIEGAAPRQRRFLWRFESLFALQEATRELGRRAIPSGDFVYTQSNLLALAYRRLGRTTPMASHTGAVIARREVLEEDLERPSAYRRLAAYVADREERASYAMPRWSHIVSTKLVARQREAHFGLPDGFFHVCPYGVDHARFDREAAHSDMRARLGIPAAAVVVASVARLVSWKNIDWVIDAVGRSERDLHLVVVGDGPAAPELRARAAASPASPRIHFTGRANPAPYLASADIFALPSAIESFGMVYAEAMLMGLPCIGLRNDPPAVLSSAMDVIPEGEAGYCVSSAEELGQRLEQLARDEPLRRSLGECGYRLARATYSTDHYVDFLRRLMAGQFGIVVAADGTTRA